MKDTEIDVADQAEDVAQRRSVMLCTSFCIHMLTLSVSLSLSTSGRD